MTNLTSTPTTDEVRADYVRDHTHGYDEYQGPATMTAMQEHYGAEFDRWLNEVQATVLDAAAERLHRMTDGEEREGTKGWPERHREVYALAIDEASDALHAAATLLRTPDEEER